MKLAPFAKEALAFGMQMVVSRFPGWLCRRVRIERRSRTELEDFMRVNTEKSSKHASIEDQMLAEGLTIHRLVSRNARVAIVTLGALSFPPFALFLLALLNAL